MGTCLRCTTLQPGFLVIVDGLKVATELNGLMGTCEQWVPEQGRWWVKVNTNRLIHFSCLESIPPALDLRAGTAVRVHDLEEAPELSDIEGICSGKWDDGDRVNVQLPCLRSVKPQNLH